MEAIRKPFAFFYNDLLNQSSYKFAFVGQLVGIFFASLSFFFLSKLFGDVVSPHLEPYGGDYFSFVLIGIAFASYLQVSLRSFSDSIRNAQLLGTLEALLVTQTEIPIIIVSSSLYSFFMTSIRVVAFLMIGIFLLGIDIGKANYIGALVVLFITIIAFSSLGIISASFVMVLKKGDPLNWLLTNLFWLLGGVYYPITILPHWLQKISYVLPITYSLEGMRFALLEGYSMNSLLPDIVPLIIFATITFPLSILLFKYAVNRAKVDGSLTQY